MRLSEVKYLITTQLGLFLEDQDRAFWVCSGNFKQMLYISPAYEKIWGRQNFDLDQCLYNFLDSIYDKDKNRVMAGFQRLSEVRSINEEYRIIIPDGSLKWIRNRLVKFVDKTDQMEYIAGIAEDITEYKSIEARFFQNEEYFQQFAKYAEIVFWVCEPDVSKFYYISPGYEKAWGKSCDSLLTNPQSFLELVHPDDLERVIAAAFGKNSCHMDEEYRIIKPDGTLCWRRDTTFPVYNEQGKLYRMAGISTDISARKQAEIETLKALQRERELSEAKTNLISIISHQIRTPLTTIQSSSDMMKYHSKRLSQDKKLLYFQKIETAIKEISNIVQDVLTLSEANGDALKFQPADIDIVKLCDEIAFSLADKHRIRFTSSIHQVQVLVDSKLIRYILTNLLENALKYSPNSSEVRFDLNCTAEELIFEISDRGIGIPETSIPHIFSSFYRANNVATISGTGLGLAIVKQCVELHQGQISVWSIVGEETTFTVTLPLIDL